VRGIEDEPMAPDVLALYGSPRRGGNTDSLMEALLEPALRNGLSVERVRVPDLAVAPCRACRLCEASGECGQKDAMAEAIPKLLSARWVALSSPVFFYGIPGQTKAFIDRCQVLWARKHRPPGGKGPVAISPPGRKGFLVAAGGSSGKNLFLGLELTARYFFDAIDVRFEGTHAVRGLEAPGDAGKTPGALDGARAAGERLFT
jgi:multimeric flavodoxin WrbA